MATANAPHGWYISLRRHIVAALLLIVALLATSCRVSGDEMAVEPVAAEATSNALTDGELGESDGSDQPSSPAAAPDPEPDGEAGVIVDPPAEPPTDLPRDITVADVDCVAPSLQDPVSLTTQGEAMLARHTDSNARIPAYQLAVDVNPMTGEVAGAMRASVPAQERTINFRAFAGMEAFDSGFEVTNVVVDGELVDATLDTALLSVPASPGGQDLTVVELDFSFTIDQMAANNDIFGGLTGESLQPDQVGLLGRTDTGMQLGHWFPVWLPDGTRSDPDPSGFGDIGAFPAANICTTITVPPGYQVITGGSRVATTDTSIVEAGAGLRDFSILISDDLLLAARFVRGIEIRVWGPTDDPEALMTVLDYADQSHDALTDAFGPYPWKEIDIVSAPLGSGVGGMEWPGAVWIEQSLFAGGIPGLGDLGDVFGDEELGAIFGAAGGIALETTLEWTVAHELGHEWWHANVGNDSIESPAVDEPLAQFAACVAMQRIHPDNWREVCEAQTVDQFAQARSLGVSDTAAEQASDQFESSLQYGAVVYGKAPGFYFAAADLMGWDELTDALRDFVSQNSFALVSTNALRSHLVEAAGDNGAEIGALWDRWFREARGDEDIEPADLFGSFGGLEGLDLEGLDLEGLDLEGLDLEGLDLEGFDFDELLGEDFAELFGEDFDLEDLLGEDANIDDLLQDFLDATEGE